MTDPSSVGALRRVEDSMLAVLEDLVMAETPSEDLDRLKAGGRLLSRVITRLLGEAPQQLDIDGRPHLRLRGSGDKPVLVLCHLDTVWPAHTTERWPFTVADGKACGPGVFDMKAGLVQALYALSDTARARDVTLLVTSDEEIGSPSGRALVEHEAARARAVLVPEPSAQGALKTARKGVSMYQLHVRGQAAHAGLDPERGINALLELAHQVPRIAALSNLECGTTVTPTAASAGTTSNTVPAAAQVAVDVRALSREEQERVHSGLQALVTVTPGAVLDMRGGINRPPLEETASTGLAELAARCARELGLTDLESATVGGGSDGNFAAALGVPTLDGLGAVGDHAHAEGEYAVVAAMAERAALVRALVENLGKERE